MGEFIKNWAIVFSIIVVLGIIGYFALPKRNIQKGEEVLGVRDIDYRNSPYITSVPQISVGVGEAFEYEVEFSDLDSDDNEITLSLTEKPSWMDINNNYIFGISFEPGTYKYVVSISDGENSTSQVNYVLVQQNE